jgi:hypothetical protein
MEITFNEFVDHVRELSKDEKEEIRFILERELIEEERQEIYQKYKISEQEYESGELVFSDNISDLKKLLSPK